MSRPPARHESRRSRRSSRGSASPRRVARAGRPAHGTQPQAAGEAALALAGATRKGRHAANLPPEEGDDPIGLAVVHGAQHDGRCRQCRHTRPHPSAAQVSARTEAARCCGNRLGFERAAIDSPSPDWGGRRNNSDSVMVAMRTRMTTNTARPRPAAARRLVLVDDSAGQHRIDDRAGRLRARFLGLAVQRAVIQGQRFGLADADDLRVRTNEASDEHLSRKALQGVPPPSPRSPSAAPWSMPTHHRP